MEPNVEDSNGDWTWNSSYLKELRKNSTLSPAHVAERLGISTSTYLAIENESMKPTISLLTNLAVLFTTSVDALVGLEFYPTFDGSLSPDEWELVKCYRRASKETQENVMAILEKYRATPAASGK